MPKNFKLPPDAASVRVLVRIARAAHIAADHLLLRSAEIELSDFGITLTDLGIDSERPDMSREGNHE